MSHPSPYDHLRPTDEEYRTGVYRVVGTDDESVTLLRVGDGDGRRVNTGELVTVSAAELDGFEPAANPDGNRPLAAALVSIPESLYWSLRAFVGQLLGNPLGTFAAIALLTLGNAGGRFVDLPDSVSTALVIAGAVLLALVGSGRL